MRSASIQRSASLRWQPWLGRVLMAHLRDPNFFNLASVLGLGHEGLCLVSGTSALRTVGIPVNWDSPKAKSSGL